MNMLPRQLMRNYQGQILRDFLQPEYRGAFTAARGAGKDFIGLTCADTLAMLKPGATIGYLGTSLKSLKKILLSNNANTGKPLYKDIMTIEAMEKTRAGDYIHKDKTNFLYKNGSLIYLLGTNPDNEIGNSLDALIITEAARFGMDTWKYLIGNVNRANGRILLLSTPFYASDFNELIDGVYFESHGKDKREDRYIKYKVPADKLYAVDGTRVYDDVKLLNLQKEMDKATFLQEYMCDTGAINSISVLGESLKLATRVGIPEHFGLGSQRELFFTFDLGNSDYTAMFTLYKDEKTDIPVMVNQMIRNRTNLEDFIVEAKRLANYYQVYNPIIVLPFDIANEMQGYAAKINRKRELEKALPPTWRLEVVEKMNIIRTLQILRTVFETGKVGIIDGEIGNYIIKVLSSINYRVNKVTNKPMMEVDKRSGMFEDHPLDSIKYFVCYYFSDMFDEEYDIKLRTAIQNDIWVPNKRIFTVTGVPKDFGNTANTPKLNMLSKLKNNNFKPFKNGL